MVKDYAVIFDMDGVIFDSERAIIECWIEIGRKYGIPDIEETCRACIGITEEASRQLVRGRYGEDFPYDEYRAEMSALFHERFSGGRLPVKAGVRELLSDLRGKKVPVALASSTRRDIVRRELEEAGLWDYFDVVICGDMVSRSKPAPDIFEKAAGELGVERENCYVIEDSYNGIRAACAAGMHPWMVPDLLPATEEMEDLAEQVFASLREVRLALPESG